MEACTTCSGDIYKKISFSKSVYRGMKGWQCQKPHKIHLYGSVQARGSIEILHK